MRQGKVTIIGAGRSGRGMLGELYDSAGYQITFADIKDELVEGLRKQGFYTVRMTDMKTGQSQERTVEGFDIIHAGREKERYLETLIHSDLISTALLPGDFDAVIEDLAAAVRLRRRRGIRSLLFITLGANYVGLYEYFQEKMTAALTGEDGEYFRLYIRLVMSIVNRKNLLAGEEERKKDPFRIIGDNKAVLRVEDSGELAGCPYLPSFFRLEKGLGAAMAVKIWTGNLVQCAMAFVALRDGLTDTYEASFHEDASRYACYASEEGYRAVAAEYGLPPRDDRQMVTIFRNPGLRDSLYRIVREPIRKFGRNDRFIGPALCCMRHGILPYFITRCLAYGFLYSNEEDLQSLELQAYIREHGIGQAVLHVCQLELERQEERVVYELILDAYRDITRQDPFEEGEQS